MPMIDIDWLKEHVEIPEDLTYEQLAKDLVRVGLEEEEIHQSQVTGPIVVGYVVDATLEPQKNGKVINWCHVDVGDEYNETDENGKKVPRGIICGAPNMAAGEKGIERTLLLRHDINDMHDLVEGDVRFSEQFAMGE